MSEQYKSTLRGWAVDRVISMHEKGKLTLEQLQKDSDALAAYAYSPEEDIVKTAKELFKLLQENPESGNDVLTEVILVAQQIDAERKAGVKKPVEAA